jgi:hypothetical protein
MLPSRLDVNVFEVTVHSSKMFEKSTRVNGVASVKTLISIAVVTRTSYITLSYTCINGCLGTYMIDVAS